MKKFKVGDKVQIIEAPEENKYLVGKTGVIKNIEGYGIKNDDVMVWLDDGGKGCFRENQLKKIN